MPATAQPESLSPSGPSAGTAVISGGSTRLLSLDVYRGLTVAAMILVTDPGTYAARYTQLCHAEWLGATATDMIMPSFLFIVGVSITLAFARRMAQGASRVQLAGRALSRWAILMGMGLLVNGFPFYTWHTMRWPGILQRIACSYLVGSLLYLVAARRELGRESAATFRREGWIVSGAIAVILAGYWWAMMHIPVPGYGVGRLDYFGNLPAWVDRTVLGVNHMWIYGTRPTSYDPDGLLTLAPGACLTLFGLLAGSWMRTTAGPWRKVLGLVCAGVVLVALGLLLSHSMPLSKKLWTSTFSLVSGGVAFLLFAFFFTLVDLLRVRRWTMPALVFGTNAIVSFAISTVITEELDRIQVGGPGGTVSLHAWLYSHLFATWMAPVRASLVYALVITFVNGLLLWPLYRRRIFLRV